HAIGDAGVAGVLALSAGGLVGEARPQCRLIVGGERGFLRGTRTLGRIPLITDPDGLAPLSRKVGIFRFIVGAGTGCAEHQRRDQRQRNGRASLEHDVLQRRMGRAKAKPISLVRRSRRWVSQGLNPSYFLTLK